MIRFIDALLVRKYDQGRISAIRESDLTRFERESLGALDGSLLGLMAGSDEEGEAQTVVAQANTKLGARPLRAVPMANSRHWQTAPSDIGALHHDK